MISHSFLKLLKNLLRFKSSRDYPKEIEACFNFVRGYLERGGLKVRIFSNKSSLSLVAARRHKKHYHYILNGHLDVVPANYPYAFTPIIKGRKIYARGASDMKGTVAAMIELMRDSELRGVDMALMLTTDEEIGGFDGVQYLLGRQKYSCSCAIIPDGGENFSLILAEKGVLHLRFVAKGKAAHGSEPWRGDNALDKLIRIYQNIKNSLPRVTAKDNWRPTVNLGVLRGGDATNKVADEGMMQLDFRFPKIDDEAEILDLVNNEIKREKGVRWEILARGSPLTNDSNNFYFKKIQNVAKKEKIRLKIKKEHGASDGRFFSERKIPVIMFKPVCSGSHINNEWIDLESLEKFYRLLKSFLRA
ncbi:MAG: M20 family metallopeptidase [Microgenomates group bacterium]